MNGVVAAACLTLMFGLTSHLVAQSLAGPRFEVTSVKPSNPDAAGPLGLPRTLQQAGGRFTVLNATVRDLVRRAYAAFFDFQIDGGPDWLASRRFDIQAKAEDAGANMDAMLPMLEALLADRFQLKVHTETREMPMYALVVARDDGRLGANITPSTADCSTAARDLAQFKAEAGPGGVVGLLQAGQGLPCAIMPAPSRAAGSMTMRANGVSMADLAQFLTAFTDRMVQDRTGLSGLHDWEMTFDRAARLSAAQQPGSALPLPTAPSSDSPSLMTALQEQLGLKLESTRGPVDVLVIDSAALPEPN